MFCAPGTMYRLKCILYLIQDIYSNQFCKSVLKCWTLNWYTSETCKNKRCKTPLVDTVDSTVVFCFVYLFNVLFSEMKSADFSFMVEHLYISVHYLSFNPESLSYNIDTSLTVIGFNVLVVIQALLRHLCNIQIVTQL